VRANAYLSVVVDVGVWNENKGGGSVGGFAIVFACYAEVEAIYDEVSAYVAVHVPVLTCR
jgi:hypothetical protein